MSAVAHSRATCRAGDMIIAGKCGLQCRNCGECKCGRGCSKGGDPECDICHDAHWARECPEKPHLDRKNYSSRDIIDGRGRFESAEETGNAI